MIDPQGRPQLRGAVRGYYYKRQIFGAGGALIQKKNKEKEKGKGKEERREKRKKERGEFNLEDPMFLLISILSSKKL